MEVIYINPTIKGSERFIRDLCCNGGSRSLIATNPEYLKRFLAMESTYLRDTNQMAEER